MIDLDDDCSGLPVVCFTDGEVIIAEGASVSPLFFLKSGKVSISRGHDIITEVSDPAAVLGEVSTLLNQPSIATVRAVGDTEMYVSEDPMTYLQGRPKVLMHIAVALAQKVNFLSAYSADLKEQYKGHSDHMGMAGEVLDSLLNDSH